MPTLIRWLAAALAALSCAAAAAQATTDGWPNRTIRWIVTFPPGGSADSLVRAMAPLLSERLGQQVIVENRPGAGGNIGLDVVAKSPPDGYTIGLGAAGALSVNVSLYQKMPFDPVKDFEPITLIASIPFVLVAHPGLAAQNPRELVALAKAQPGTLTIGHGGNGTAMHLSAELLKQTAGIQLVPVAYKGSGPAAQDATGGQVHLAIVDLPSSLGLIRGGRLKAIGVTPNRRVAALPDVPTLAEAGVAGFESIGWFGAVAPAGTPGPIVQRLN
ncbi:MAG TPA: tripartite tricarboxylate transporter substrate-binding protein, partial [Burkholderiaceae bacterium]|nr:tripartite tricarboxylate transporter substrate-binding protein [Burkholderiaceae bacterium]